MAPLTEFKFRYFGHDQVVLHEREIRKRLGPFKFLNDPKVEKRFHDDLSDIMKNAPFTLIAGLIDKSQHKAQYAKPTNPYDLALTFCLERLQFHLNASPKTTVVVFEKRGDKEDRALELEFRRICDGGNALNKNDKLPFQAIFADKQRNSSGLQFSDLVARPIGLRHLHPDQPNRAWDILKPKFRTHPYTGAFMRAGLKVFP